MMIGIGIGIGVAVSALLVLLVIRALAKPIKETWNSYVETMLFKR